MNLLSLDLPNLYYENGVLLGQILMKEDGYYDFWPELKGGYWSAEVLRQIADLLDQLNAPWEKEINDYFANSC